jgi:phenylpropionate dioxygenase-like ring-hydroxylating dioxygenase large terminal subunit
VAVIPKEKLIEKKQRPLLRFFHPVLPAKDLGKKPKRVYVDDEAYVLFRSGNGITALLDRCSHRFAPLSKGQVRGGRLECPYHGWTYDSDGVVRTPSHPDRVKCQVPRFQVAERHGVLWLGNEDAKLDNLPSLGFDGYREAGYFNMAFDAPFHVALDNFSENEHTPWVHTRFGWPADRSTEIEFSCEQEEDSIKVSYAGPQRPTVLGRLYGLHPDDRYHNDWETRFDPPRTHYQLSWTGTDGKRCGFSAWVVIYFVPEREKQTRLHAWVFAKAENELLSKLMPAAKHIAKLVIWKEVFDDARFVKNVADAPYELKGMKLGRYDKPIAASRKLLDRIYYGREGE